MYNVKTAYALLKARMDRAGMSMPAPLEIYWTQRLDAAAEELKQRGITLEDTIGDNMLVADLAAERLHNRDKAGGLPAWLTLQIRQRWWAQRRDNHGS